MQLHQKKHRQAHGFFLVEGVKIIQQLIEREWPIHSILASDQLAAHLNHPKIIICTSDQLQKISTLHTSPDCIAAVAIPQQNALETTHNGFVLGLDKIRDPGNLGTIIRLCHWFGIQDIICSEDTVDAYNPKTVQASMGSFLHVNMHYTNLVNYIKTYPHSVYLADLNGKNIYQTQWESNSLLIMGNESKGPSPALVDAISRVVTIPSFGTHTESLNVAMATGIILGQWKSQLFK